MNTSLVGRQIELTDAMKVHIESAIETLKKYNLDIISVRVVVSPDEKKGIAVEFSINIAHKNTIVIRQEDKDMYAAVDLAVERAKKVLRRYHDKITDHIRTDDIIDDELDGNIDEIVPMELELYKPLAYEDAVEVLKDSKRDFLVYLDYEDNVKVLIKNKDDIKKVDVESEKELTIEEALEKLKSEEKNLMVFVDEVGKIRVLHKIKNNLFSLY
jgi:putative sigma-54 modulation protein